MLLLGFRQNFDLSDTESYLELATSIYKTNLVVKEREILLSLQWYRSLRDVVVLCNIGCTTPRDRMYIELASCYQQEVVQAWQTNQLIIEPV